MPHHVHKLFAEKKQIPHYISISFAAFARSVCDYLIFSCFIHKTAFYYARFLLSFVQQWTQEKHYIDYKLRGKQIVRFKSLKGA